MRVGSEQRSSTARETLGRIGKTIRWTFSLGNKFRKEVPVGTGVVVLATLVSQLSALLAFFLPLKVLILLGSDGIPRYFPPSFESVDRDVLIVWMAASAVAFYMVHLLAERAIALGADKGGRKLLQKSRKLVLFENQDQIAEKAYRLFSRGLAGGVFVLLAALLLAWLYPAIAIILVGYSTMAALAAVLVHAGSSNLAQRMESDLRSWVLVTANLGFLLAFFFLVADFLYGNPPGLIPAIIALILSKQTFNRMAISIAAVSRLSVQRERLNALFFHRHVFTGLGIGQSTGVWNLLSPGERESWVPAVVGEFAPNDAVIPESMRWWPASDREAGCIQCGTQAGRVFLLKIHDKARAAPALHESDLLQVMGDQLPCPDYLGTTTVSGCRCNIFQLSAEARRLARLTPRVVADIRSALIRSTPAAAIIQSHSRSRPYVWRRLRDTEILSRLHIAADGPVRTVLDRLQSRLPEWCELLEKTPLSVTVPRIEASDIVECAAGRVCLTNWSGWTLEPVGFAWGTGERELAGLRRALDESRSARRGLEDVSPEAATLAALTAELEALSSGEEYEAALQLLPRIETMIDRAGDRE